MQQYINRQELIYCWISIILPLNSSYIVLLPRTYTMFTHCFLLFLDIFYDYNLIAFLSFVMIKKNTYT